MTSLHSWLVVRLPEYRPPTRISWHHYHNCPSQSPHVTLFQPVGSRVWRHTRAASPHRNPRPRVWWSTSTRSPNGLVCTSRYTATASCSCTLGATPALFPRTTSASTKSLVKPWPPSRSSSEPTTDSAPSPPPFTLHSAPPSTTLTALTSPTRSCSS